LLTRYATVRVEVISFLTRSAVAERSFSLLSELDAQPAPSRLIPVIAIWLSGAGKPAPDSPQFMLIPEPRSQIASAKYCVKRTRRRDVKPKDKDADKSRRSTNLQDSAVGYGRPPVANRFKPGTSGNLKGRPKGAKNLRSLIREAMIASIPIQEGEKTRRVTRLEGVVLRQIQGALKGNDKSAMAVLKMALQLGLLEDSSDSGEISLGREDERILNELLTRSRRGG
jgi:hypothetical protein